MRLFFLCLLIISGLSFPSLLKGQCQGSIRAVENFSCPAGGSVIHRSGNLPAGYGLQIFISQSPEFDFATVTEIEPVDEFTPIYLVPSGLAAGQHYSFVLFSPLLANDEIDYDSPCLRISDAAPLIIIDNEQNLIPDTTILSCQDFPLDFTPYPNAHPVMLFDWQSAYHPIQDISLSSTASVTAPGTYIMTTEVPFTYFDNMDFSPGTCRFRDTFTLIAEDFVLPQVLTFDIPCNDNYDICLSPWSTEQSYTLNGEIITDACLGDISVGSHELIVNNENCSDTLNLQIRREELSVSLNLSIQDCVGEQGKASIRFRGDIPPYQLFLSNGDTLTSLQGEAIHYQGATAEIASYTATSAGGCMTSGDITFPNSPIAYEPSFFDGPLPETLCDINTGFNMHGITPYGGDQPYEIEWSTGETGEIFTLQGWGTYEVTITSASGCVVYDTLRFGGASSPYPPVVIEHDFCNQNIGSILQPLPDDTASFNYLWSTGDTSTQIDGLPAGTYRLTVSSSDICTFVSSTEIRGYPQPELSYSTVGNLLCYDTMWVSIDNNQFGEPFNSPINWYNEAGDSINNDHNLAITTGGIYTARALVPNTNECWAEAIITVNDTISPDYIIRQQNTGCDYVEVLYIDDKSPSNNYLWTLPDGSISMQELIGASIPGTYALSVYDPINDCQYSDTYNFDLNQECGLVSGSLILDDGDCQEDETDMPAAAQLISIVPLDGSPPYYAITDQDGVWNIQLPIGAYHLSFQARIEGIFNACQAPILIEVDGEPIPNQNLRISPIQFCPRMRTTLSAPILRRCFNSSLYAYYENGGSVTAEDVVLTVELDPYLNYSFSSLPPSQVDGQTLHFNLGDLAPFQSATIRIVAEVSCEAELGLAHCSSASISPSTNCPTPNPLWSGAMVEVQAYCEEDQVRFVFENTGTAEMTIPLQYIIVEDGVMIRDEPFLRPPLTASETFEETVIANGSSYWLIVNQEPLSPYNNPPSVFVEGCGLDENGEFTIGQVNQFSHSNEFPWFDQLCLSNIGAYDPNDKNALPVGYGEGHHIEPYIPIDYTIRFQNTGTDTAFNIVLKDTLNPLLDCGSLQLLGSSHPYRAELDTNAVLSIYFDNIQLPDSSADQSGSNGFFQFQIQPRANITLPFEVSNQAGIYFDFNEPIITNKVVHTIDTNFILRPSGIFDQPYPQVQIFTSPNPSPTGWFELGVKTEVPGPYLVRISDIFGRPVWAQELVGETMLVDISKLPSGSYNLSLFDRRGGMAGYHTNNQVKI